MKNIMLMLIVLTTVFGCTHDKNGEAKMGAKNLEPTVQHCIGRSLIDLPSSFGPTAMAIGSFKFKNLDRQGEPIDVIVRSLKKTPSFVIEVQKRKAELTESSSPTVDVLREVKELGNNAALFRVQRIDDAYVSEIVFLRGSSIITARLHSFREQYLAAEEMLIRFAAKTRGLDNEKGSATDDAFCLGTVEIGGDFAVEKANFLFRNGQGAEFDIDVDTYTPDERVTLLARMSGPNSLLKVFDVKHTVLRAGERTVAGMRAQEWMGSAQTTDDADARTLQFTVETMRSMPSKTTPSLQLTFETAQPLEDGSQTTTSISKDEAIRLWDSVVGSLRPAK